MTIVFISNYYNHHQAPLCREIYNLTGDAFTFIQTEEMSAERRELGYGKDALPPYVKMSYGTSTAASECAQLVDQADVVIIGGAPNSWIKNRIRDKKIVIRYSERVLKKGLALWKYPYRYFKMHWANPKHTVKCLLCASAYAASDYACFGLFKDRCYKWGYFPEVRRHADINEILKSKRKNSLLWVSRFIELKHPEAVIAVAERLKKDGYIFTLSMIGIGPLQEQYQQTIQNKGLSDVVFILGAMSPEAVRTHMEQAEIFLFTSDRNEGWGAVLNESMNSGCSVVASHSIGSVPFLIKEGENGLIYRDGDVDDLYKKVKSLLDNATLRENMGRAAYETLCNQWNAEEAAKRLIQLAERLRQGEETPELFSEDICSKAFQLKDDWYL